MKTIVSIAVAAAFALSAPAFAGETSPSVQQQLKELTKMVGAGEISSKDYNKRKRELLASAEAQQQTAESNSAKK